MQLFKVLTIATSTLFLSTPASLAGPLAADLAPSFSSALAAAPSFPGCRTDFRTSDEKGCEVQDDVVQLGKQLYIQDDSKFVEIVAKQLSHIESAATYRYLPILLASLSRDSRLVEPLRKLAAIEKSSKLKFDYATQTLSRLSQGSCSPAANDNPRFREVCTLLDRDFNRIRLNKGLR